MPLLYVSRLGNVSVRELHHAAAAAKSAFPQLHVEVLEWRLEPEVEAYDAERAQYVSDEILEQLHELREELDADYLLAVAGVDAYTWGLNFVFGQANPMLRVAAVYTPRLRPGFYGGGGNETLYLERLEKEVIHELGHLLGLGHCTNPRCVMRFSNTIFEVDSKTAMFCRSCAHELEKRGVKVSPSRVLDS
ncbi:MAG: archaemetzincin family Zn-dependent metalloprotease [Thermoproteota archaeon]